MWFGGNAISNHIITVAKGITGKARNRTDYASKWYNFQNHLNGHFYVQGRLLIILKYLPESLQYPWQSFEQPIRFWLSVTWASLGVSNAEDGNSNDNMQYSIQKVPYLRVIFEQTPQVIFTESKAIRVAYTHHIGVSLVSCFQTRYFQYAYFTKHMSWTECGQVYPIICQNLYMEDW